MEGKNRKEGGKIFNHNLLVRVITALIMAPLVLAITYYGGIIFKALVLIAAILMAFEWNSLVMHKSHQKISDTPRKKLLWQMSGVLYIALPCISLIWIAEQSLGHKIVAWLLIAVWLVDIAAFFGGKIIGGPKLAPKISPNKTWSGFITSLIAAFLFGLASLEYFDSQLPYALVSLTLILAIFAQAGDLLESWVKRKFGIKDSGHIIPGHGGILDRVDSLVFTATKVAFSIMFCREIFS